MFGCTPKSTKGQVFIVTRSAENIKLGLVEVLLLDEEGVAVFLGKKKPAVEAEVSLRAENLRKAEKELREGQHELEEFQRTNEAFQPVFLEKKARFSALKLEIREMENGPTESRLAMRKKIQTLQTQMLQSRGSQSLNNAADQFLEAVNLKKELDAIDRQEKENAQALGMKKAQNAELQKQITAVTSASEKNATELSNRVASCTATYGNARSAAARFPTLEFYLSDPLPAPRMKTVTDADGKFELNLRRKGRLAVFARASRSVGSGTENYAWFFWLPTVNDDTPLMLSNNNLVFADYHGNVLPIKPKEAE